MSHYPNTTEFRPYRAILAGFCGSTLAVIVLLFSHIFAQILSQGLEQFTLVHALVDNDLTVAVANNLYLTVLAHFVIGLGFAVMYAKIVDQLPGANSWRSGLIFSSLLWVLSGLVFFPLVGAGFFGLGLGAGALPFLGSLVLHLAYGFTLGLVYSPYFSSVGVNRIAQRNPESGGQPSPSSDKAAALGILGGAATGGLLVSASWLLLGRPEAFVVAGMPLDYALLAVVLFCTGIGMLLGFWNGLPNRSELPTP